VSSPRPAAAALVSLLWPGLGQLWLGQTEKGALLAILALLTLWCGGLLALAAAWDAWVLAGRRAERPLETWESAGPVKLAGDAVIFTAELVTTIF
jgi:hypothetical protein